MDDTALYTATETGRALLEALDAEEPFRLLSTIPEKLQELCTIGGRRESTTVGQWSPLTPDFLTPVLEATHRGYHDYPIAQPRIDNFWFASHCYNGLHPISQIYRSVFDLRMEERAGVITGFAVSPAQDG